MTYHTNPKLEFYYITHLDNLLSILEHGILSRKLSEELDIKPKQIANLDVVKKRKSKGLTSFANLYIHPRNAMLYQISKLNWRKKIIILGISSKVLEIKNTRISIGNAAANSSIILPIEEINNIPRLLSDIREIRYWGTERIVDISKYLPKQKSSTGYYIPEKQFLQSEVLVPSKIPPSYIKAIYVPDETIKKELEELLKEYSNIPIIISPDLFFQQLKEKQITNNIKVVQGDMFISDCKLLTISVNTVGVMGKGLASRFKYMYPEAYVVYQDMCKNGKLKPGQPQIYWSENYKRFFLFFPTKRHWKENSKIEMINQGLNWCLKNLPRYQLKISSAAFPALGCGLGKLNWEDVGPLMIKKLSKLENMQFEIYLPADRKLPEEYFSMDFYLNRNPLTNKNPEQINLELF